MSASKNANFNNRKRTLTTCLSIAPGVSLKSSYIRPYIAWSQKQQSPAEPG